MLDFVTNHVSEAVKELNFFVRFYDQNIYVTVRFFATLADSARYNNIF